MRTTFAFSILWLVVAACQPMREGPTGFAYSSTITILETKPAALTTPPAQPPAVLPIGMVYVPGGYTQIGSAAGLDQEKPLFWVSVKPFLLDQHEVSVGQFSVFVQATGYRTQAEKFGNAGVFDDDAKEWHLIEGANWQYPYGPKAGLADPAQPVAQVSWNDAQAYAKWAGKRLPDEIEWEHAARNGHNSRTLYPFGDSLRLNGK
jgi:sulfatase modifying factor 1